MSDEFIEVYGSLEMATNHSAMSSIFNQPNHFSMFLNSIIFRAYSFFRYGISADLAFTLHEVDFWTICRCYGAFMSILMIPVTFLILSFYNKRTALLGALLTAIFPSFVYHAHVTLPDTPLTLMVFCAIYFTMRFLRKPGLTNICLLCFISGLSIAVKYCGALVGLLPAYCLFFMLNKNKDFRQFSFFTGLGLVSVFSAILLFSPALIIHWRQALAGLSHEAAVIHIGGDGGSYLWKLGFYFKECFTNSGIIFLIPVLFGILTIFRKNRGDLFPLLFGIIYCLCMSTLKLHWERWAVPMYTAALLSGAIGLDTLLRVCENNHNRAQKRVLVFLFSLMGVLVFFPLFTQSVMFIINYSNMDTRVVSEAFCETQGITTENSIYQCNTPLAMITDVTCEEYNFYTNFISEDGQVFLRDIDSGKQFIVLSSNMYNVYFHEPERYAYRIEVIERIKEQYQIISEFKSANYFSTSILPVQILKNVSAYLKDSRQLGFRGPIISIYRVP